MSHGGDPVNSTDVVTQGTIVKKILVLFVLKLSCKMWWRLYLSIPVNSVSAQILNQWFFLSIHRIFWHSVSVFDGQCYPGCKLSKITSLPSLNNSKLCGWWTLTFLLPKHTFLWQIFSFTRNFTFICSSVWQLRLYWWNTNVWLISNIGNCRI